MKILILGGTRFIGKAIARHCVLAGHEVTLFNRGKAEAQPDYPTLIGDIHDLPAHAEQLHALKPDAVIHCIAYTPQEARDCVEVFKGLDTRLLILGSMDCYEAFRLVVNGQEAPDAPIRETHPVSTVPYYWRGKQHGGGENYDKNLMTDVFMDAYAAGLVQPTVFRLPMVYGPGDYQYPGRHGPIIRRIVDAQRLYPIGASHQANLWTFGYVDNMAAGVVHALSHPQTIGKIYNLGETQARSWRRWMTLYGEAADWTFDVAVAPDVLLDKSIEQRNMPPQHLLFDCTPYLHDTGFHPPVSLEAGIQQTLAWGLDHPEHLGASPDYAWEAQMVAQYTQFLDMQLAAESPHAQPSLT